MTINNIINSVTKIANNYITKLELIKECLCIAYYIETGTISNLIIKKKEDFSEEIFIDNNNSVKHDINKDQVVLGYYNNYWNAITDIPASKAKIVVDNFIINIENNDN